MKKKFKALITVITLCFMLTCFSVPTLAGGKWNKVEGTWYEKFTFSKTTTSWDTTRRMYLKKKKNMNGAINFEDGWAKVDPLYRPPTSDGELLYNTINVVMNGSRTNVNTMRYSEKWGCLPHKRTELKWNKGVAATDLIDREICGWISMQYNDSGTTYVRGTWSPK